MPVPTLSKPQRERVFKARTRALAAGAPAGSFEVLVAAYGVRYPVGFGYTEEIARGAFSAATGNRIPVMAEHDWASGPIGSGVVTDSDAGIIVRGSFYLEDSERARVIYRALSDGSLTDWSIGFMPDKITTASGSPSDETIASGDLIECSSVLRGANPGTSTLAVRTRQRRTAMTAAERTKLEALHRRYGHRAWFRELVAGGWPG